MRPNAEWTADRNVYDLDSIAVGDKAYTQSALEAYRRDTSRDAVSRWESLDNERLLTGKDRLSLLGKRVGANFLLIPGIGGLKAE